MNESPKNLKSEPCGLYHAYWRSQEPMFDDPSDWLWYPKCAENGVSPSFWLMEALIHYLLYTTTQCCSFLFLTPCNIHNIQQTTSINIIGMQHRFNDMYEHICFRVAWVEWGCDDLQGTRACRFVRHHSASNKMKHLLDVGGGLASEKCDPKRSGALLLLYPPLDTKGSSLIYTFISYIQASRCSVIDTWMTCWPSLYRKLDTCYQPFHTPH